MRVQNTSGNILVNGSPVTKKFKSVSAYVQQDDILNGNLTVFECLFFTALLRLPSQYSYAEKRQICHDIIDELGLRHCMQTKIGIPGVSKGISGGERKRVSIAVEMLTSPSVLFLDEPTSGLDSKTALSIMTTIIKLAKNQNRTVVCTIHQPRSDIFSLFDKLLLLSGGKVAYFGDAQESVNYFDKLGYPMPEEYNPADHLIDLITKTANDSKDFQEQIKIEEKRIATLIEGHQKQGVDIPPIDSQFILENRKIQKYNQYVWWEFLILIVRFTLANLRDRMYTVVRSFQALSMAILVGLIYLQVKNNQKSIQDRMGAIFFILINQTMNSLYGAVTMFQAEKVVFLRERAAKTYRVGSYYLAKVLAEVIMVIILPTIFTVIAYWMVGFKQEAGPFFFFLFIIILVNLVAQGLGIAISTLMPSIQVAMALSPILTTVLMIFGGFYLNASTVPPYFIWIYYISFFRYGFEALIVNEFTGRTFVCLDSELITSNGITICPITTGEQVIQNYSMENVNIWLDVAMLCGLIIITRIWGYIFIRFVQRPKISR